MKVLIADDSLLVRTQMKSFLEKEMKFEVITASDGDEAITIFELEKPDLITMDITMPQMNGLQALEKIMEIDPEAKVIMISALSDNDKINEAYGLGAQGYVAKPLRFKSAEFVESFKEEILSILE